MGILTTSYTYYLHLLLTEGEEVLTTQYTYYLHLLLTEGEEVFAGQIHLEHVAAL